MSAQLPRAMITHGSRDAHCAEPFRRVGRHGLSRRLQRRGSPLRPELFPFAMERTWGLHKEIQPCSPSFLPSSDQRALPPARFPRSHDIVNSAVTFTNPSRRKT